MYTSYLVHVRIKHSYVHQPALSRAESTLYARLQKDTGVCKMDQLPFRLSDSVTFVII